MAYGIQQAGITETALVLAQRVGQIQHLNVACENVVPQQRLIRLGRHAYHRRIQRVDVVLQFDYGLCLRAAYHLVVIRTLEVEALHRDLGLLNIETVMAQAILRVPLIVARLLIVLAVVERDVEELLVGRKTYVTGLCYGGCHVAVGITVVIYEYPREQSRLRVLMLDTNAHVVYTVEEEPVLKLQHLLLTPYVIYNHRHLFVSVRHQIVHYEETAYRDEYGHYDQRLHDPHERHAGRLHRQQLVVLAQVSHRHDRRQKHRQRQTHRDHVDGCIAYELDNDTRIETLAHKLVDVTPHEIHHQHEGDDEEGHDKRPEIGFEYQLMYGFESHRPISCYAKLTVLPQSTLW